MYKDRITIFKNTTSDWIPSFKVSNGGCFASNLVRISKMLLNDGKTYRLCAWGVDDFGMEFDSENYSDINHAWIHILGRDNITIEYLKSIGFKRA
jgi:hypothetical protein